MRPLRVISAEDGVVSPAEKIATTLVASHVWTGSEGRATDRMVAAPDPDEDQTDRLENQKVREVLQKAKMFNLPDKEVERKVRGEIPQSRFSIQKTLEEEATDLFFEQKPRGEEHPDLLQNQTSRFSILADRLLEQKVRDSILQGLEEEQKDRF